MATSRTPETTTPSIPPVLIDATGKVALIAGAAGGIGSATVGLFRSAGARAGLFDLVLWRISGDDVVPITGDVSSERDCAQAVERTVERFGRLDYVINAVGRVGAGKLVDTKKKDWDDALAVNLDPAFFLARAAHPHLAASRGAMVFISSTNGRNGGSHLSGVGYAVAKAGIINLTRYLAKEWAAEGIRVNCVAPGPVATPMLDRLTSAEHAALKTAIPLGRYAQANEVAATIAFLCSAHAASITGACLNVSGGMVLD